MDAKETTRVAGGGRIVTARAQALAQAMRKNDPAGMRRMSALLVEAAQAAAAEAERIREALAYEYGWPLND